MIDALTLVPAGSAPQQNGCSFLYLKTPVMLRVGSTVTVPVARDEELRMTTMRRIRRGLAVASFSAGFIVTGQAMADGSAFGASWQLNETSGSAVDSSGNGNNGTLHGAITRTGTGYHFDGSSGYVSVPNSSSLNPGSADITITIRFSLDGNPARGKDYDLIRKGLAGTSGGDFKVEILDDGRALCRFRGGNAAVVQGGTNLGNGTHTVQCLKTGSKVSLVVDGSVKASKSVQVGSISNKEPVILAAKPGDDFTKGLIDFITIG